MTLLRKLQIQTLERRNLLAAGIVAQEFPGKYWPRDAIAETPAQTFFFQDDGVHGRELWASDGTLEGTRMVLDVIPGPEGPDTRDIYARGEQAYFVVEKDDRSEIWRTDGTPEGTQSFFAMSRAATSSIFVESLLDHGMVVNVFDPFGEPIFIDYEDGSFFELGVSANVGRNVRFYESTGDKIFYGEIDGSNGLQLYVTDGTDAGTVRVTGPGILTSDNLGSRHLFEYVTVTDGQRFYTQIDGDVYRINPGGTGNFVASQDQIGFIHGLQRVGDRVVIDTIGSYYEIEEDGSVTRVPGSSRADQVLPSDNGYYFTDNGAIYEFDSQSNRSTQIVDAPVIDRFTKIAVVGDWLLYDRDESEAIDLIAFHTVSNVVLELETLVAGSRLEMIASTDHTAFLKIDGEQESRFRLVDLNTSPVTTLFEWTSPAGVPNRAFPAGDRVVANVQSDFGVDTLAVDLMTGRVTPLPRAGNDVRLLDLERAIRHDFSKTILPVDASHFAFRSKNRVWVTDGTRTGTQSVLDGKSLVFETDSTISSGQDHVGMVSGIGDVYYPLLQEDYGVVRIASGNGPQPTITKILLPDARGMNASQDGLLYFDAADVREITGDSPDGSVVVTDYRSRTLAPMSQEDLAAGDPFQHRVTFWDSFDPDRTIYASDGTADGTGAVDSVTSIMERTGATAVQLRRYSPNTVSAEVSIDGFRHVFVERPTEQGLQPFFPLDHQSLRHGFPTRVATGWILSEDLVSGGERTWFWKDSEPAPVAISDSAPFNPPVVGAVAFDGVGVFDGEVNRDLVAFSDSGTVSLHSLRQWPGSEFVGRVIGRTETSAVVAAGASAPESQVQLFQWDGTAEGLNPIDAANDLIESIDFAHDLDTAAALLEEYIVLNDDHRIFRIPYTERTVAVTGSSATMVISQDAIDISGDTDEAVNERVTGEALTIDATSVTGPIQINLADQWSLPINDLVVDMPADATVELLVPETNAPIRYDVATGHVDLFLAGRTLTLRFTGSLTIREVSNVVPTEAPDRDILVVDPDTEVTFENVASDQSKVNVGTNVSITFGQVIDRIRVVGRAAGQSVGLESLESVRQIEVVSDAATASSFDIAIPAGFQVESSETGPQGYLVSGTDGISTISVNIAGRPLHNPFSQWDVNSSKDISSLDALLIINHLATRLNYVLTQTGFFPDVNDDLQVSGLDALLVINALGRAGGELALAAEAVIGIDEEDTLRYPVDEVIGQLF